MFMLLIAVAGVHVSGMFGDVRDLFWCFGDVCVEEEYINVILNPVLSATSHMSLQNIFFVHALGYLKTPQTLQNPNLQD